MDGVRAVPEESFRPPSWIEPVVTLEKSGQRGVEKINSGKRSFCTSQCHESLSKPGTSTLPERNESFTNVTSDIKKSDERDSICSAPTDSVLDFQRDIINVHEELKKTDEYKLAVEKEWAPRHLQLKLQDEEKLNLKERLCAEVRQEFYCLGMTCFDMASLLHGLGIHMGGRFHPLSLEVHAAYKQALLKFHSG